MRHAAGAASVSLAWESNPVERQVARQVLRCQPGRIDTDSGLYIAQGNGGSKDDAA
jgi:hypothetical protein